MYAKKMTDSMNYAIEETNRRRSIQEEYNKEHGIVPKSIIKDIRLPLKVIDDPLNGKSKSKGKMTRKEREIEIRRIEKEMKEAARNLDFERAATLRDILFELKAEL